MTTTEIDIQKINHVQEVFYPISLSNEDILRILESYKDKRIYDKKRYHTKLKHDPVYIEKQKNATKKWILNNPEKHKLSLDKTKDRRKLQVKLNYYRKTNQLDKFKTKFPTLWDKVLELHLPHSPIQQSST